MLPTNDVMKPLIVMMFEPTEMIIPYLKVFERGKIVKCYAREIPRDEASEIG